MIDPATGWIGIYFVAETRADLVANQKDLAWLTRYPLPNIINIHRGKELLAKFKTMIANNYGILCNSISIRNPQANAIVERVHQTIGNIIHTFIIQEMDLDNKSPWEGILSSTMFAIQSTVHTTSQHTPSQLVFGLDAMLNINQEANWQLIKQHKQVVINKGNQKETSGKQSHEYHTRDKYSWKTKIFWNNGTVHICRGNITDTYNLHNITPFEK